MLLQVACVSGALAAPLVSLLAATIARRDFSPPIRIVRLESWRAVVHAVPYAITAALDRTYLIQCRELEADVTALTAKRDELAAQAGRLQKEVDDTKARLAAAEKAALAAQAALDAKRAKKRQWKATAHKFEQLWQSVSCLICTELALFCSMLCNLLLLVWAPCADVDAARCWCLQASCGVSVTPAAECIL